MAVHHLEWSSDAKSIACLEGGSKMCVKNVVPPTSDTTDSNWTTGSIFDTRLQVEIGYINQILLDTKVQYLLITSKILNQVWSLGRNSITASIMSKTPGISQRWINHPVFKDRLIAGNSVSMVIYQWNDLAELSILDIDTAVASGIGYIDEQDCTNAFSTPSLSNVFSPFEDTISIDRLMVTQDRAYIMMQSSHQTQNHKRMKTLHIFEIDSFQNINQQASKLQPLCIPQEIRSRIEIPLGKLPKDRLVFLDRDYWMCTWRISSESITAAPTKHFFLPKDWISAEALSICTVTDGGVFLYPRNGEVAVIECGLEAPEMLQS